MEDSRKFKVEEIVRIRGTRITAVVTECFLVDKKWQYKLKGWPNPIDEYKLAKNS